MTAPSLTPLEALTVEAFGLTLDEELDFDIACGEIHHDSGLYGHAGPASHWGELPCHHEDTFICQPFVNAILGAGGAICGVCKVRYWLEDIRLIPVTGGTK